MFAIPAIVGLLLLVQIRPQEFLISLRAVPWLYLFFALSILGYAVDIRTRLSKVVAAPQLQWIAIFFVWCIITLVVRNPAAIQKEAIGLLITLIFGLAVGHTVQSFRGFQVITGTLLAIGLFLAGTGIYQGMAPFGCLEINDSDNTRTDGKFNGQLCTTAEECRRVDPEPGKDYACERVGLFGTFTVEEGRVRYLGTMQDPNELALVLGVTVPFAFAFYQRKRSLARLILMLLTVGMVGTCIVMTKSRGGQLVMLTAMGAYFIRRYGIKGMVVGGVLASPMLLLGGREGEKASASSMERIECMYEGIDMFKSNPLFGVGKGQFTEHHYLTAHNSYLLVASELGLPGMFLWSVIVFLTMKTLVQAIQRFANRPEAEPASVWAMALLASMSGMLVGCFFLSYSYEQTLWVYLGLVGAFFGAAKRHDPAWEVKVSSRELVGIAVADVAIVVALFVYSRLKVA